VSGNNYPNGIEIENREELFFFLAEAAELEHMLCCSYLFAAFSLKGAGEGLSEAQMAAVAGWKKQLSGIAVQEMGHLALVNTLLAAVGAAPHFQRPNFPQHGRYYPPEMDLTLAPLTPEPWRASCPSSCRGPATGRRRRRPLPAEPSIP
jgi:hypothetical protein